MKKLFFVGLFLLMAGFAGAQDYYTAVGLRGGASQGVTVKHFVNRYDAIEGILAFRWGGFIITGLYEFEQEFAEPGFSWYYGFGGHLGHWNSGSTHKPHWWKPEYNDGLTIIGVDAIAGLSYTFDRTPINISLDWKPSFNLIGYSGIWADGFAFSIRYTFK